MRQSKKFFSSKTEEVKAILELLEDEKSKICFRKMIKFRCESNYFKLPQNAMKTQYFFNDFFRYNEGEIFVDCGAFDGDSIRNFKRAMKKAHCRYQSIVAFEPDEHNCRNLERNHEDVKLIRGGVWDCCTRLMLDEEESVYMHFLKEEKDSLLSPDEWKYSYALDSVAECREATFIKMDIEGAEQKALQGAKNIIMRNKPKLAVCIYHNDADMLEIPRMVHEWVPEYKLYIRQHSNCIYETVLYATL